MRTLGILTSSRSTVSGIGESRPGRRMVISTVVPFGPLTRFTTSSVVQPLASSVPTFAMMSPRRMPARYAGEPSKSEVTVTSSADALNLMPMPK